MFTRRFMLIEPNQNSSDGTLKRAAYKPLVNLPSLIRLRKVVLEGSRDLTPTSWTQVVDHLNSFITDHTASLSSHKDL
jgi:hypothetical protein